MSIAHISWAMEQKTGSPSRKAVLVALADFANAATGKCFPHIAKIAEVTELSEATVKRSLVDLALDGYFTRTRDRRPDGTQGGYHYQLPIVKTVVDPGSTVTPDPGSTVTPQEPGTSLEPTDPPVGPPATRSVELVRRKIMVDRKQATDDEITLAASVLGLWNNRAGQNLTAVDWIAKIIMRIREHPEFELDHHVAIIEAALADPWWKGPASPSVVYGSGAQFERSVEAARSREQGTPVGFQPSRYGRGMTTRQILDTDFGGPT